ncbi:MAG: Ig-like domain-containing protein [Deltaproteobacteria bacterium]|nr:Ig-like domain-containing protein [Deltaproteobacteria bacterium]
MRLIRSSILPVVVVLAAACGDDEKPKNTTDAADTGGPDTEAPVDTWVAPDTEPPDVAPAANVLGYAPSMIGSNGVVCTTSCAMRQEAGANLELAVVYRDAQGTPLVDRNVSFDAGDAPEDVARLSALSGLTDANGVARVTLRTYGLPGSVTVTARVASDPDAGAREFVVTLEVAPAPDLAASFEYLGNTPAADFKLKLFEKQAGGPSCASIYPDSRDGNRAPDLTQGPYLLGQQARVATLPGLAAAGTQTWLVQFVAPADGAPVASGCVEVVAQRGTTATAYVYVLDLPRRFQGDFGAVTRLDIVGGAEGTGAGTFLSTLTELFTRPGRLIVTSACRDADGILGDVCWWITNSEGEPNFLGEVVTGAADAALLALFEAAVGENTQDATQLISEMLRDLRLLSIMRFAEEPATPEQGFEGAYFGAGKANEEWTHVRFRWKLDPSCKNSPNPQDCGWASIPLELIYGQRPTAALAAGVDMALALHVEVHPVPLLTYGPLINAITERYFLPLLFEGGGDEPVDSWDDFVAVLFGDRLCLQYDDCCEYFADRIYDSVPTYIYELAPQACEIAIPLVAAGIRAAMAQLAAPMHVGTSATTGGCMSQDATLDRWSDGYGTVTAPCEWELYFPTQSGTFYPDNDWRAVRQ